MKRILICLLAAAAVTTGHAQTKSKFSVIAYYMGNDPSQVDRYDISQLTHIIYSFCHLKGSRLHVDNQQDSVMIRKLVSLKEAHPQLKVMLSLGGWGGCETCSSVFADSFARHDFARSVLELSRYFGTDGLDLDWEYPTISGYPGHLFQRGDRLNFTKLVKELRATLGKNYEISFAAGGFDDYIDQSIIWKEVMPLVDRVNLMTYDLVHGFSTTTGHHTPLYSTTSQKQSVDNAVTRLIAMGVPSTKLVIGAAFYGRMWEGVDSVNNGLYRSGKFKKGISFSQFTQELSPADGYVYYWDSVAHAPYIYNSKRSEYVTYEDTRSIAMKTQYAIDKKLGGIMFWELNNDLQRNGLLNAIDSTVRGSK